MTTLFGYDLQPLWIALAAVAIVLIIVAFIIVICLIRRNRIRKKLRESELQYEELTGGKYKPEQFEEEGLVPITSQRKKLPRRGDKLTEKGTIKRDHKEEDTHTPNLTGSIALQQEASDDEEEKKESSPQTANGVEINPEAKQ